MKRNRRLRRIGDVKPAMKRKARYARDWNLGALLQVAHALTYRIPADMVQKPLPFEIHLPTACRRTGQQLTDVSGIMEGEHSADEQVVRDLMKEPWPLCELVALALFPFVKIDLSTEEKPKVFGRVIPPFIAGKCVSEGRRVRGYEAFEAATGVAKASWTRVLRPGVTREQALGMITTWVEQAIVARRPRLRIRRRLARRQLDRLPASDEYRKACVLPGVRKGSKVYVSLAVTLLARLNIKALRALMEGPDGVIHGTARTLYAQLMSKEFRSRKKRKPRFKVSRASSARRRAWEVGTKRQLGNEAGPPDILAVPPGLISRPEVAAPEDSDPFADLPTRRGNFILCRRVVPTKSLLWQYLSAPPGGAYPYGNWNQQFHVFRDLESAERAHEDIVWFTRGLTGDKDEDWLASLRIAEIPQSIIDARQSYENTVIGDKMAQEARAQQGLPPKDYDDQVAMENELARMEHVWHGGLNAHLTTLFPVAPVPQGAAT